MSLAQPTTIPRFLKDKNRNRKGLNAPHSRRADVPQHSYFLIKSPCHPSLLFLRDRAAFGVYLVTSGLQSVGVDNETTDKLALSEQRVFILHEP